MFTKKESKEGLMKNLGVMFLVGRLLDQVEVLWALHFCIILPGGAVMQLLASRVLNKVSGASGKFG